MTAALAARWPEGTWETTHLGGHRFSGTLLALPSGIALGRLDVGSAGEAVTDLDAGRLPVAHARGRAGVPGAAQVAELHLRAELGLTGLADVTLVSVDAVDVVLDAGRPQRSRRRGGRWCRRATAARRTPSTRSGRGSLTSQYDRLY